MTMKYDEDYNEFISSNSLDEHINKVADLFDCDSNSINIIVSQGSVIIEYIFEDNIENKIASTMINGDFDVGMPIIDAELPGLKLIEGGKLTDSALTWEPKPNMFEVVSESIDVKTTIEIS